MHLGIGLSITASNPPLMSYTKSGLILDADAAAGFAPSQWSDQSGNGNHLLQSTPANQPSLVSSWTNGQPGILFSSSSVTWMSLSAWAGGALSTGTILAVFDTTNATDQLLWDSPGGTSRWVGEAYPVGGIYQMYAGSTLAYSATVPTSTPRQLACVYNGASSAIYLDGVQKATGNPGSNTLSDFLIGGRFSHTGANQLDGHFGKILVWNRALTTTELAQAAAYMRNRFGVA